MSSSSLADGTGGITADNLSVDEKLVDATRRKMTLQSLPAVDRPDGSVHFTAAPFSPPVASSKRFVPEPDCAQLPAEQAMTTTSPSTVPPQPPIQPHASLEVPRSASTRSSAEDVSSSRHTASATSPETVISTGHDPVDASTGENMTKKQNKFEENSNNGFENSNDNAERRQQKHPIEEIPVGDEEHHVAEGKTMDGDVGGEEAVNARLSMVKDENGFVYYRCRFCGLTFNFMTTLKAHERVHDVMQPYLCNKCGESFHYMCELEYHAKSHLKQKGYKCDCGRTFYQYTDLLYHKHPDEVDEASRVLPLPAALPTLATGSGQAPPIDPAAFPTPEYMEKGFEPKHPLKVYSEVRCKPYICQYCSKSYADSRGLAYHMYSHRGEKMFNPRASRYLMCRNENSYLSPGVPL